MLHQEDYAGLHHRLCRPAPRTLVVPSESIFLYGDEFIWRPQPADKGTLPPEATLRLALWVLNAAASFVPSSEAPQRALHGELRELAALIARFLTDPTCPIGKRTEGRRAHPLVARQLVEIEAAHTAIGDYFLLAGGEHSGRTYRYPLVLILRFITQVVRLAWSAASTHSPRARRLAGYQLWRAFEWTARLALRSNRARTPTGRRRLLSRDETSYVATALWRAAVQTVPIADVLVAPLRRRAVPRWEWAGPIVAAEPEGLPREADPGAPEITAATA